MCGVPHAAGVRCEYSDTVISNYLKLQLLLL